MEAASALGPRAAPKSFWSICAACFTGSITGCGPLFLEYACSTLWAFAYAITILLFILSRLIPLPDNLAVHSLFPPEFTGIAARPDVPAAVRRQPVYRAAL
ncbi:biofilm PGA synthesis N-glycosyltransferase PgaC [Klebsiella pneumoniae]|uniref:Biofilm PGA synthesis N-glycosyltransferase PgaC n=1 Tax=Klebsiella pneumoniae TaxID=573 RepID=A0A3S4KGR2_KLEPN|nr:biofilm PGA synthesis N-glycosyltransferase PgaC [Klebsiella pneumoniae]